MFIFYTAQFIGKRRKNVSRVMFPERIELSGSLSFIYVNGCPKTKAAYPPATDEQSLSAGILDIATHGM